MQFKKYIHPNIYSKVFHFVLHQRKVHIHVRHYGLESMNHKIVLNIYTQHRSKLNSFSEISGNKYTSLSG